MCERSLVRGGRGGVQAVVGGEVKGESDVRKVSAARRAGCSARKGEVVCAITTDT